MKVKMKSWEKSAIEHARRFTSSWDYWILSASGFQEGYKQAREDANKELLKNILFNPLEAGEEPVEVEFKDGKHSLAAASFNKWKQENSNIELRDAMSIYLKMFDFKDLRITETNGVISFQGTCTRKQEFNGSVVVQD